MIIVKKILKWSLCFLLIPMIYVVISFVCLSITVPRNIENQVLNKSVFLSTNGVHLDIILPTDDTDSLLLSGIKHEKLDNYLSFGWGDENFYINTPTWGDLTFSNAFRALFLKSSTLMHVTRYQTRRPHWIEIKISESEFNALQSYIQNTFKIDNNGNKIILKNEAYSLNDNFYKAKNSYSCFKTCNSWVNTGFKESGLKSCLWTPFDFGLINKYKN